MKKYTIGVTQDRGAAHLPASYHASFSGTRAACEAFGMTCRAAMIEPWGQTKLRAWCRVAAIGSTMTHRTNLRTITVTLTRIR